MPAEEIPEGSVLVGTDGSPMAERAMDYAVEEAHRRGLGLHVLYAFPWAAQAKAWEFSPPPELVTTGEQVVAAAAERVDKQWPDVTVTNRVVVEDPAIALVEASRHAALTVVGARGQGDVADPLMGSVAQKVAAHAHSSVVVVRGETPPDGPVVVGMDPVEGAPEAMEYAFEEATRRGARLVVVQGAQDDAAFPDFPDAVRSGHYDANASEHARVTAERLNEWHRRYPEVPLELRLVRERPVRALVEAAEGAAILVVGSRGRGGLAGFFLGSVSRGVLNRAPLVAVVRARPEPVAD